MIAQFRGRLAITLVVVAALGGSLAGCGRGVVGGESTPAAGGTTTATPTAPSGSSGGSSLSSIQDDLNAANSATTNASGDVADADSSAATSDSP